ncbi:hypothetical protein MKEN_01303300 [Mycena kentingensis (nom. inval.)]|nr:hypothetical protein MKEN_01303300 [Mycena kentingensis (nom. inval.)]
MAGTAPVVLSSNNPFRNPAPAAAPATSDRDVLNEDLPPAYTYGPDGLQGERTLELGPSRPFQQAPPVGWLPQPHGQHAYAPPPGPPMQGGRGGVWQQLAHAVTGGAGGYPGQAQAPYTPPPNPPPPSAFRMPHPPAQSEFARDFYATPPSAFPSSSTAYAPPPGAPPRPSDAQYASPPAPASIVDDGKPTTTPVPGHPLLRNGQLLVYPAGVVCSKCDNVGYKHSDPAHPCTKCWDKYAKAYTGALAAAPSANESTSTHGSTFQRPLARIYARPTTPRPAGYPGAAATTPYLPSSSALYPPPPPPTAPPPPGPPPNPSYSAPPHPPPNQSYSAPPHPPPNGPYSAPPHPPPPGQHYPPPQTPYQHPVYPLPPGVSYASGLSHPPPPGPPPIPISMAPGDARIGGAFCWRCMGSGTVELFPFVTDKCRVCRGVGRVWG